jgi:predicted enzyme related to lactoylglutathione lyase
MSTGFRTVLFPTADPSAAKAVFTELLGAAPIVDEPYYVGWKVAGQDIGLVPGGRGNGMTGAVVYWEVDDVKAVIDRLQKTGATVAQDVTGVGGGKLVATMLDVDGNAFGLSQSP